MDLNDHLIIIKESPSKKRKKILGKKWISPDLGDYLKKTEKEMNKTTILGWGKEIFHSMEVCFK